MFKTTTFLLILFVSTAAFSAPKGGQRNYPGGVDEEDLKVQEHLVSPVQKVYKSTIKARVYRNFFKENQSEDQPKTKKRTD